VRVNDVLWEEVPSLYQVEANRQAYIVRIDDNARPSITFGDAHFGARLLTGMANVTASYRSGIGPDGEVAAGSLTLLRTMPMGLRGVTNALPASGAEAPETLALARDNAPLTVLTFERVVSLPDFEDFARTFPGIGKALADVLTMDGNAVIHLTVAGATGGAPGEDTLKNLIAAIGAASDSSQRFIVSPFTQRYFTCRARVVIDPRYRKDLVLSQVAEHVRQAFSFEARHFGQSVTAAEVVRVIHEVAGVVAVDLDVLAAYSEETNVSASAAGTQPVVAHRARWQSAASQVEPAELLLINPVGIELEELLP
jgi:predicted phage baseplate assembly protein